MKYSEKENFVRVVRWDSPSHVSYGGVSQGICYSGAWPGDSRPGADATEWQDMWGVTWIDADGEVFPAGAAVSSAEHLDRLHAPDPHTEAIRRGLEEQAAKVDRDRYFLCVGHPYLLYEKGFNILGPTEFLMALATGEAEALLDMLIEFELGIAEEYVRFRPDHVNTMDDYGMQDRLTVSPEMWRRLFKPRLKRLIDFYRDALGDGLVISHHSCGHVMPILEDFIELGVDIINPIQTTANDLAEMRRITSHRLVLAGGIDGQRVLPNGTPEQVRQEVFDKLDLLWEDGGYLPFPEKMLGVPDANARAMEQAIRDWSDEHAATACCSEIDFKKE
jgi:uroporphyrinogen decarboxylase